MTAPDVTPLEILRLDGVTVRFDHAPGAAAALDHVSLSVRGGTTLGVVGESGSGKSTMAKAVVGTVPLSDGRILLAGDDLALARGAVRWRVRREVQLIPQNPYASLNPRRTIGATIAEALDPRGRGRTTRHADRIAHWLEMVQLPADTMRRYPHEFSGGQRQRIAIARALAVGPRLVIADEITSALDATVQKEVLALIARLQAELGFTMMFISHNLAVVQEVSDEVLVLLRGQVVEHGRTEDIFQHPSESYTRSLLDAIPGLPGFTLD